MAINHVYLSFDFKILKFHIKIQTVLSYSDDVSPCNERIGSNWNEAAKFIETRVRIHLNKFSLNLNLNTHFKPSHFVWERKKGFSFYFHDASPFHAYYYNRSEPNSTVFSSLQAIICCRERDRQKAYTHSHVFWRCLAIVMVFFLMPHFRMFSSISSAEKKKFTAYLIGSTRIQTHVKHTQKTRVTSESD